MFEVRTDLALEESERLMEQEESSRGISVEEETSEDGAIRITTVRIETENAGKIMGKPKGTYITLEAEELPEESQDYHREVSKKLSELLSRLIPVPSKELSVLVAGLGNRNVTPDALGPQVVDHLFITRHLLKEYGKSSFGSGIIHSLSAVIPGVMAQTGMETREILSGVIAEMKPDYLIAIDALAARSARRLCRTIQISDTGIHPGSGVGNHRHRITRETTGIPVIAIGIPTVVEAATIVQDSMADFLGELSRINHMPALEESWHRLSENEHRDLVRELLAPQLNQMFVTTKDIDAQIRQMSYTVSEAINMTFCSGFMD